MNEPATVTYPIWTLIAILVTAVSGFLVAVARFVFYPMA